MYIHTHTYICIHTHTHTHTHTQRERERGREREKASLNFFQVGRLLKEILGVDLLGKSGSAEYSNTI
jgi:hypothetical protein